MAEKLASLRKKGGNLPSNVYYEKIASNDQIRQYTIQLDFTPRIAVIEGLLNGNPAASMWTTSQSGYAEQYFKGVRYQYAIPDNNYAPAVGAVDTNGKTVRFNLSPNMTDVDIFIAG